MEIVYLKWVDSYSPDVAWACHHDLNLDSLKESMVCESVGYIVAEDEEVVILSSSQGGQEHKRLVFAPVVIPKVAIRERREVNISDEA